MCLGGRLCRDRYLGGGERLVKEWKLYLRRRLECIGPVEGLWYSIFVLSISINKLEFEGHLLTSEPVLVPDNTVSRP